MKKILILVAVLLSLNGVSFALTVDLKVYDGRDTETVIWYNPSAEAPAEGLTPINGATVRILEKPDFLRYRDLITDSHGSCTFTAELGDKIQIWKTAYDINEFYVENRFVSVSELVVAAVVKLKNLYSSPRIRRAILPRRFRY